MRPALHRCHRAEAEGIRDHPWHGHTSEIIRIEKTLWGERPVVRLDDGPKVLPGQECFVMKPRRTSVELSDLLTTSKLLYQQSPTVEGECS